VVASSALQVLSLLQVLLASGVLVSFAAVAAASAWCRFPLRNINLFSAMVGVGTQVLVIALCVFGLALVGMFYPYNRGAMLSACVVLYALTAGISGEQPAAGRPAVDRDGGAV